MSAPASVATPSTTRFAAMANPALVAPARAASATFGELVVTAESSSGVPHPGHAPRGVTGASWTIK
jgi:hypothetical protein